MRDPLPEETVRTTRDTSYRLLRGISPSPGLRAEEAIRRLRDAR